MPCCWRVRASCAPPMPAPTIPMFATGRFLSGRIPRVVSGGQGMTSRPRPNVKAAVAPSLRRGARPVAACGDLSYGPDMTPDEFRELGHALVEWVAAYRERIDA